MSQVGFEPTIPVFEQAKIVHVLAGAASVIGRNYITSLPIYHVYEKIYQSEGK
jgi:hypothetical protein